MLLLRGMAALIVVCLLFATGCGTSPGFPAARLSGKVTIDGSPVESGAVTFLPLEKDRGPTAGAEITGGSYLCPAVPLGKVRVTFAASKKTGRIIDDHGRKYDEVINIVPASAQAGVEIEVTGDNSEQDFALTSP